MHLCMMTRIQAIADAAPIGAGTTVVGAAEAVIRKAPAALGAVVAPVAVGLAAVFDILLGLFGKFWLGICLYWDICRTFGLRFY